MKETDLRDLEKGNMIRVSWRGPDTNELKYGGGRFNTIHYDKKNKQCYNCTDIYKKAI